MRSLFLGLAQSCLALAIFWSPPAAAALKENALGPTPLVLKDGRIAQVVVHAIPFESGTADVSSGNRGVLEALLRPLATDCFLTAQAIGHVRPGPDGDALEAHRLARARADKVQTMLIDLGLPAAAIASVWDWQFLVKEPRVTLWVFRLNEGEDCKGTPLAPNDAPAVAANEKQGSVSTQAIATIDQDAADARAVAALQAAGPAGVADPSAPGTATDAAKAEPAPAPAPGRATQAFGGGATKNDAAPEPPRAAQPLPSPERPAPVLAAPTTTAALPAGTDAADIVFAVNSSYLPKGATASLRQFLAGLAPGGPHVVEVTAAVGTGDVSDASPEEARRYNRWMAERRVGRITEWLNANADGRRIEVRERYDEGDASRSVRITARAQS